MVQTPTDWTAQQDLLNAISGARSSSRSIANQLHDLAAAMARVGQDATANELNGIAGDVICMADNVWHAHGAAIAEDGHRTAESFSRIITTCLDVVA